MATAAVQQAPITPIGYQAEPLKEKSTEKNRDVQTTLFYYKDPGDGSPPAPTYVGSVSGAPFFNRNINSYANQPSPDIRTSSGASRRNSHRH
jgi:hypothetical protein